MDKLERLARAMCAADGIDPDTPSEHGEQAPGDARAGTTVTVPHWHRYREQARRVTAAFEAMQAAQPEPRAEAVPEGGAIASGG